MTRNLVCAVDVGTGSARAGLFERDGRMLSRSAHPIFLNRPNGHEAEHDSQDIWRAVCTAVRAARQQAGVEAGRVAGIGFDATCSLVVRGSDGRQLPVSRDGEPRWDTIAWLDHRAMAEADRCTRTGHAVLRHLGGVMSPEMQTPKLMWLKRHRPSTWDAAAHFFDLADFLTWRASGSTARSQCTLTAKWTYLGHERRWDEGFFRQVGLEDIFSRGGLPEQATPVGAALGPLTSQAAAELGLDTGCVVGTGLIDAFAGALGVLGGYRDRELDRRLALITGTSSCLMGLSREATFVSGIWGPYFGSALPERWLYEGGQSAAGALLDHLVRLHGAGGEPDAAMHARIIARIEALRAAEGPAFAAGIHVLPDFHGNRSPLADPHARGVVSGLTLDSSFDGLCRVYFRAAVAIALGVRHILEHLNAHGHGIDTLHVTGGHLRNPLLLQLYADATGLATYETGAEDAMLLGTAMVACAAAGLHADLPASCLAMRPDARRRAADIGRAAAFDRDYRVFLKMHEQRRELDMLDATHRPEAGDPR